MTYPTILHDELDEAGRKLLRAWDDSVDEARGAAALTDALRRSVAAYEAMTPAQKREHDEAQRQSWVRGMQPCEHGVADFEECADCRRAAREKDETMTTDKFTSPEQPPEGLDRELLTILAEECCEIGQRCSKALRFGIDEVQTGQLMSNAERISEEVGDMLAVVQRLTNRGILSRGQIDRAAGAKRAKLDRYLQSESGPMTTDTDLVALRQAAEAATPGRWRTGHIGNKELEHVVDFGEPPTAPFMAVKPAPAYGVCHSDDGSSRRNAAFIAAACPATVLALLDRIESAEATAEKLYHAMCSESGFSESVRIATGCAWPWPAEDEAKAAHRAHKDKYGSRDDG